jgi:hypothetical protein
MSEQEPFELQDERRLLQGTSWSIRIVIAALVVTAASVFWWAGRPAPPAPSPVRGIGPAAPPPVAR